jgi:hypothetical protein
MEHWNTFGTRFWEFWDSKNSSRGRPACQRITEEVLKVKNGFCPSGNFCVIAAKKD